MFVNNDLVKSHIIHVFFIVFFMNNLIISLFYTPEPVARPHDLAVTLTQMGHRVNVITAYPNYPQGQIYPGYQERRAAWEEVDGVQVLRVPHRVDRSRSALRRVLSYTSFSIAAVVHGLQKIDQPDVIWTYQIGLPGVLISKLRKVPLVHEVQDLWPDWGRAANLGLRTGAYRLLERQEQMIYRQAQKIVTITKGFKQELIKKGAEPTKIEIIPNWANDAVFRPVSPDADLAANEGFSGFFNVVYIGNVGAAQALGVVLGAADLLRESPDIRIVIIGDGVERAKLETRAQEMGLTNVRFLGSRPQNEVANYMALADVLFLHLQRDRVYEITIPSKTYGYLASGRPILAAAEGELAHLITEYGAGVVCAPENAQALAQAIWQFRDMPVTQRDQMGQAGYQAVSAHYSRINLGAQYSRVLEKAVESFQEGKR